MNKTALSYWFPLIEAAGLPVPKTRIIKMPQAAQEDFFKAFDGEEGDGQAKAFAKTLEIAGYEFGYPLFLRTDFTSAKHSWNKACFVAEPEKMITHIWEIIEYSEVHDMLGDLPWDTFVLREMLPTIPLAVCPRYGNMPVCREFRFFVRDGEIICAHPYWPKESLQKGGCNADRELMENLFFPDDRSELQDLAKRAGRAVGGAWSVDILETKRGWFVTDLAEASKSFHWEGCAHQHDFPRERL
jgi:ATP-grasp domain, R2K clade family 3